MEKIEVMLYAFLGFLILGYIVYTIFSPSSQDKKPDANLKTGGYKKPARTANKGGAEKSEYLYEPKIQESQSYIKNVDFYKEMNSFKKKQDEQQKIKEEAEKALREKELVEKSGTASKQWVDEAEHISNMVMDKKEEALAKKAAIQKIYERQASRAGQDEPLPNPQMEMDSSEQQRKEEIDLAKEELKQEFEKLMQYEMLQKELKLNPDKIYGEWTEEEGGGDSNLSEEEKDEILLGSLNDWIGEGDKEAGEEDQEGQGELEDYF